MVAQLNRHAGPAAAWRRSYARRTGAERGFATARDPATNDITRGWCRLMGLAPLLLFTATLLIVRNQRILAAWNARQEETQRRAAAGLPPKTRKRRRKTLMARPALTPPPRPRTPYPPPPVTTSESMPETRHPKDQAPPQRPKPRHRTTGYQETRMSDPT